MQLFIIRHAWAGEPGDGQYQDDRLRRLTPSGIERFRLMVQTIRSRGFEPRVIATSPLVRCRQTAEIVSELTSHRPPVFELPYLEPGADLENLVRWTVEQDVEQLAWVGHAPDVGLLTAGLIGRGAEFRFAKGAIASIRFEDGFHRGRGELKWLVTAKILGC